MYTRKNHREARANGARSQIDQMLLFRQLCGPCFFYPTTDTGICYNTCWLSLKQTILFYPSTLTTLLLGSILLSSSLLHISLGETMRKGQSKLRTPRQRASRACSLCRKRKVRCDMVVSGMPCTRCRLDRVTCIAVDTVRSSLVLLCEPF